MFYTFTLEQRFEFICYIALGDSAERDLHIRVIQSDSVGEFFIAAAFRDIYLPVIDMCDCLPDSVWIRKRRAFIFKIPEIADCRYRNIKQSVCQLGVGESFPDKVTCLIADLDRFAACVIDLPDLAVFDCVAEPGFLLFAQLKTVVDQRLISFTIESDRDDGVEIKTAAADRNILTVIRRSHLFEQKNADDQCDQYQRKDNGKFLHLILTPCVDYDTIYSGLMIA